MINVIVDESKYPRQLSLGVQDTKRRVTTDHEHLSRRYALTSHIRVANLQDGTKGSDGVVQVR